jgi:hypothetical protein
MHHIPISSPVPSMSRTCFDKAFPSANFKNYMGLVLESAGNYKEKKSESN